MLHFGFPSVVRGVRHGLVPLFLPQLQISCLAAGAGSPLTVCLPRAASPRGVLLACALFCPWRAGFSAWGQHGCQLLGQLRATGFYFHVGGYRRDSPVAAVYATCGLCRYMAFFCLRDAKGHSQVISHFGKLHKRWVIENHWKVVKCWFYL